jgi:hypothetical protein
MGDEDVSGASPEALEAVRAHWCARVAPVDLETFRDEADSPEQRVRRHGSLDRLLANRCPETDAALTYYLEEVDVVDPAYLVEGAIERAEAASKEGAESTEEGEATGEDGGTDDGAKEMSREDALAADIEKIHRRQGKKRLPEVVEVGEMIAARAKMQPRTICRSSRRPPLRARSSSSSLAGCRRWATRRARRSPGSSTPGAPGSSSAAAGIAGPAAREPPGVVLTPRLRRRPPRWRRSAATGPPRRRRPSPPSATRRTARR